TAVAWRHDDDAVRAAQACVGRLGSGPVSENRFREACNVNVYGYGREAQPDFFAGDAWFWSSMYDKNRTSFESSVGLSLLAGIPALLWFFLGIWVRWLTKPAATATAALLLVFSAGSAKADSPGHFGKVLASDGVVAAWDGCRDGVVKGWGKDQPARVVALHCACIVDAIRTLNPNKPMSESTNLVLPSAKQAQTCFADAQSRVANRDQATKGYFGIGKWDLPTENVVGGYLGCTSELRGKISPKTASSRCGCVVDAMRANARFPYGGTAAENQRVLPTSSQLSVCESL
ncbi:MAG TPA: hypothetical protein VMK12_30940, partial [Anaeromyxobacteraceae bacterium]|nr:hypothetical protein [Anaeromyxobacteraceae bacterium]